MNLRQVFVSIALALALQAVLALHANVAFATNPDDCSVAQCSGPEVGQYLYSTGSYPMLPGGAFYSEAAGISEVTNEAYTNLSACNAYDESPAWLPLPGGSISGSRSVGDPSAPTHETGDYWTQAWDLSQEYDQWKWTTRIKGTLATNGVPACANNFWYVVGMRRQRMVACATGWQPNQYTAPTGSYCWRAPTANFVDPCAADHLMQHEMRS